MWLRPPFTQPLQVEINRPQRCHIVTVTPTGSCSINTVGESNPHAHIHAHPRHFIQQQTARGRAFVHRAMGRSENGIPSEYEKDFLPSVWQSVQGSCILNFRVAFDSKQLYMIAGCECLPLRWKIFCCPCRALVCCEYTIHSLIWLHPFSMSFLLLFLTECIQKEFLPISPGQLHLTLFASLHCSDKTPALIGICALLYVFKMSHRERERESETVDRFSGDKS